ncbi:hypothetical protein QFZ79_003179 [Arthrobacter sp. V4I6]|nr:hypothetical protein [Arthrobacter sp. V1I7]MDQ0855068.1 hypothetical protein [Arthrobacter sp. V4I6]
MTESNRAQRRRRWWIVVTVMAALAAVPAQDVTPASCG